MGNLGIGKQVLSFLIAIAVGLIIGIELLNAHKPVQAGQVSTESDSFDLQGLGKKIIQIPHKKDSILVSLKLPEVRNFIRTTLKQGEPYAIYWSDQSYYVNENGEILEPDTLTHYNLPVITGDAVRYDLKNRCISGETFNQALNFLQMMSKSPVLYPMISEIHLDESVGLLVYLNHSGLLPVIVGKGILGEKATKLNLVMMEMGTSQLLSTAKYLDLRIEGQVVLKKK